MVRVLVTVITALSLAGCTKTEKQCSARHDVRGKVLLARSIRMLDPADQAILLKSRLNKDGWPECCQLLTEHTTPNLAHYGYWEEAAYAIRMYWRVGLASRTWVVQYDKCGTFLVGDND